MSAILKLQALIPAKSASSMAEELPSTYSLFYCSSESHKC